MQAVPQRHHRLLADLGEALRHAADLPGGSDPLGAGAQAPLLRGHRRDRRRAHHVDPRVAGLGAHLGLSLLLAPRRLLRPRRLPAPRSFRGARAVHPLPAQRRLGRARPRSRAALPHRRAHRPRGVDPHGLARLPGRAAGPRRQRRRAPQAARRLRRDGPGADAALPRRPLPRAGDAARARSRHRADPPRRRRRRHAGRRHLGAAHRVAAADLQLAHVLGRRGSHDADRAPARPGAGVGVRRRLPRRSGARS